MPAAEASATPLGAAALGPPFTVFPTEAQGQVLVFQHEPVIDCRLLPVSGHELGGAASSRLRDAAGSLQELTFPADVGNAPGPTLPSFKGLSSLSTVQLALLSLECSGVGVRGEMKKEKESPTGTQAKAAVFLHIFPNFAAGHPPGVRL